MWRYTNETAWISSSEWGLIHKTSGLGWSDFSATASSFPDGAQTWAEVLSKDQVRLQFTQKFFVHLVKALAATKPFTDGAVNFRQIHLFQREKLSTS